MTKRNVSWRTFMRAGLIVTGILAFIWFCKPILPFPKDELGRMLSQTRRIELGTFGTDRKTVITDPAEVAAIRQAFLPRWQKPMCLCMGSRFIRFLADGDHVLIVANITDHYIAPLDGAWPGLAEWRAVPSRELIDLMNPYYADTGAFSP